MVRLAADLWGPVGVELARAVEQLPGEDGMPGGARFELKWDGYRCGAVCRSGAVRLWSRNGKEFTDRFPDVQAALAEQVVVDSVLDGELVVWAGDRLDFASLQERLVNTPATVRRRTAPARPASLVVFDVLAIDGVDIRMLPWTGRRGLLESLAERWRPPLQLSPVTGDVEEARQWLDGFGAEGVEGLVVKGASTRYEPGKRAWVKWKIRETVEVIVGAVTGSLQRPEVLIAGRYRGDDLIMVGRTVPLTGRQATELAGLLKPAGPEHPWPDEIGSGRWGGQGHKIPLVKVRPEVVVEVAADLAVQAGQWRHPLRLLRYRADLTPGDVDALDTAAP